MINTEHLLGNIALLFGSGVYLSLLAIALELISPLFLTLLPVLFIGILISGLFLKKIKPDLIILMVFGILYIIVPFGLLNNFYHPVPGSEDLRFVLIGFFLLVWINDIFAYLTGILIGKHKLFERISPKKTWEGSIGGLVFTLGAAWVYSIIFTDLASIHWIVIAIISVVFGIFGDLFESLLKRKYNLKDTGTILPGHGGLLDRVDAMLFSAPAVLLYLILIL
jgi:phosphatidate cytidylyltransferase